MCKWAALLVCEAHIVHIGGTTTAPRLRPSRRSRRSPPTIMTSSLSISSVHTSKWGWGTWSIADRSFRDLEVNHLRR
jgi:hypothetical protein